MDSIVYISCSSKDRELATKICETLVKFHINTYISCGAKNIEEKFQMIEKMSILLLLFSKESLKSSIIDNEVTEAINRQLPIVPYQVDDTSIKESLSLDFMLKKSQWILGYPDRQKQMDDLIVSICRYLGIDAIQQNPTDPFEQFKRGIALEFGTNGLEQNREQAVLWLEKSALQGNFMAMYELYKYYRNSEDGNIHTDYNQAREWLIRAADAGLAEAQYILGTNYEVYDEHVYILYSNSSEISQPLNIRKDLGKARKYYVLAAKQGNKKAMFRLGMLCLNGEPSSKDKEYAFKLLTASSDIDEPILWLELGYLYKEGFGGTDCKLKSIECFQHAKHLGKYDLLKLKYENGNNYRDIYNEVFKSKYDIDPRFCTLRASFYLDGNIVKENLSIASNYILKASKLYNNNYSIFFDKEKSEELLQNAASLGNAEALYNIGLSFYSQEQYTKAFIYFSEAALKQVPIAKLYIGIMSHEGLGTIKDDRVAFYWLSQSDIPGLAYSTTLLGDLYLHGAGTEQNIEKAIKCYKRAANQDEYVADLRLHQIYKNGWGVDINAEKADYWFLKAKQDGYEP